MNRSKAGRTPSKHRKRLLKGVPSKRARIVLAVASTAVLVGSTIGATAASAATRTTHQAVPAASPSNPVSYNVVDNTNEVDWTLDSGYTADPSVLVQYNESETAGGENIVSGSVSLNPGQTKPAFMDECYIAFDVSTEQHGIIQSGSFTVPANCTAPEQKPSVNLQISKSEITEGDAAPTLSWTSQNATSLTASGSWSGSKAVPSGNESVSNSVRNTPGTYTFTLKTNSNSKGQGTDSVTLKVDKKQTPPPQCVKATTANMGATSSDTNASVNPKVNVCATKLYWQEYVVSKNWDGNGFDHSAYTPAQYRVEVDSKTVQGSGKVSFSVPLNTTDEQYDYQYGCYVNRQIDLTDVDQTTVNSSGSHGTLYTYVLKRFKVSDHSCNYVPPTPKDASGDFTLTGVCGTGNDVVNVTAVNATADKPVWSGTKVSVTFTANQGHLFSNGQRTLTVTKDEVDTSACPVAAQPKVEVQADSCVMPGAQGGKTLIVVTNTADDTHASTSYTVAVTEQGKTDVTLHTGPIADGASKTLTVLGLQPGSYGVAVTGDDMTGAGTSFVLTACQKPTPPLKQIVSVNIAATGANCGPTATETYYVGGQLDKVTAAVTVAGKQVHLSSTDSFAVDSGQTWSVVFTVKDSANTELPNGKSTETFSGKNNEKPFACPAPPKHHQPTPPNGPVPHTGFTGTFVSVVTHPYAGLARFLEGVSVLGGLMLLMLGFGLVRRREASQQ